MIEKKEIEKATAKAFISLYNNLFGTSFYIKEYGDAPDIQCEDSKNGGILNLEIVLTQDRPGDIMALLGRSSHKSIEDLKTSSNKNETLASFNCLQENVVENCIEVIKRKMKNNYGPNTALVVRDTSPLDWNWEIVINEIRKEIESINNNFDKGIWIISSSKDKLYRII